MRGSLRQFTQNGVQDTPKVFPQGMTDILVWVRERYGRIPMYITENGAAFYDPPVANGTVEDPLRVDYLREHLRAARHDNASRRGLLSMVGQRRRLLAYLHQKSPERYQAVLGRLGLRR